MYKMYKTKSVAEQNEKVATSGNRTRAARVAGEHSTTEPTLQSIPEVLGC